MCPKMGNVRVILHLKAPLLFRNMKRVRLTILSVLCLFPIVSMAQTTNLSDALIESVVLYIHHEDSISDDMASRNGEQIIVRRPLHRYVIPELIGVKDLSFSHCSKNDDVTLVWLKKKSCVKRIMTKSLSENYHGYYRVTINIEDGEFVVYVMKSFKRKVGETLQGRFSYGIKNGLLTIHTIEFQGAHSDSVVLCNPNVDKVVYQESYNKMFAIYFGDSLNLTVFSDTIDILHSINIWKAYNLPTVNDIYYTYESFLSQKTFSYRTKPFLSVDYTFNKEGDILAHFRTIYCQKQHGKYKKMQQICSSDFVFTLSQDSNGMYSLMTY